MAEIKLTKSELRVQQFRLNQLQRYLPTLQLKKSLLQAEVDEVKTEVLRLEDEFESVRLSVTHESKVFSEPFGYDLKAAAKITTVKKRYENIAGVDIPIFENVIFDPFDYPLFSTPIWLETAVFQLRQMAIARAKILIAQEKKQALEKELREVTIRVNLFEKNLIPKSLSNIKKIKVFLGDQQLAAVCQAKVAKTKIEERKRQKKRKNSLGVKVEKGMSA